MGWMEHPGWERVDRAVTALATGTGSIQDRMNVAGGVLVHLVPADFREGRERLLFERIMRTLTESAPGAFDEGAIRASTLVLSDQIASDTAAAICDLHRSLLWDDEAYELDA
jgi:hypothetical protein